MRSPQPAPPVLQSKEHGLIRGVSLPSATALNLIDMIGVGPFITIPLIIAAMGGPQAMLGWVLGAALVICDGLVWAELGAAFPGSGGSYRYLREIYGRQKLGHLLSFLFIWQLTFSAPLSIASGCIGLSLYAGYIWPPLAQEYFSRTLTASLPLIGTLEVSIALTAGTLVAIGTCLLAVFLLYRRITIVGRLGEFLWVGVMVTIVWIILTGLFNFDPSRAFSFPPGAFNLSSGFFMGLGAAMLIAIYDYWGYYNVCFFGGEVKDPARTIPRAIIYSILIVAAIYLTMNTSILGVIPWQELMETADSDARRYVISVFMQRIYGSWAGYAATLLVMWTAFASVFSLLLGYSRVPYAAALDGNYFRFFTRVHKRHHFPHVSLLVLGAVVIAFCFLRLADVIAALVVIRILIQFLAQTVGVVVFRIMRPEVERPFRMWLYPLPSVVAFLGFLYVLISRNNFLKEVRYAAVLIVVGLAIYLVRSWRRREWPFGNPAEATPETA